MGKKNKQLEKGLQWLNSFNGKNKDLEERLGIDRLSYGGKPGESGQREAFNDMQSYNDRMVDAARNDYDMRRTLEAAAMSGKQQAQDILDKGFNSIGDIRNAQNFSEKAAKRHGQGGDFSSASDYMGLTQSMVERDRNKQMEAIADEYATKSSLEEFRDELEERNATTDPVEAPELSATLVAAQEGVDDYAINLGTQGDGIVGRTDSDDLFTAAAEVDASPVSGESEEYKDEYTANVKGGLKLSGIATRGPWSGIREGEGF